MPADASATAESAPYGAVIDAIVGRREEQQDNGLLAGVRLPRRSEALLMLVADGMGGHVGGAVASAMAVEAFQQAFFARASDPLGARLRHALRSANAALAARIEQAPDLAGMGCTLVAVVLHGHKATWISVGDTILSSFDRGGLRRLNEDHSVGGLLDRRAERGEISREEALGSPQRHMLRSALTGDDIALIDEGQAHLGPGALLFAASDGILTLSPARLAELAAGASPKVFVRAVLDAIGEDMPSDQDNTTVAAAAVPGRQPAHPGKAVRWIRRLLGAGLFVLVLAGLGVLGYALLGSERRSPPKAPEPVATPGKAGSTSGPPRPARPRVEPLPFARRIRLPPPLLEPAAPSRPVVHPPAGVKARTAKAPAKPAAAADPIQQILDKTPPPSSSPAAGR